jgi:hypothetical protein
MYVCHCFRTCLCDYYRKQGHELASKVVKVGADLNSKEADALLYTMAGHRPKGKDRLAFIQGWVEVKSEQRRDHKRRWGW